MNKAQTQNSRFYLTANFWLAVPAAVSVAFSLADLSVLASSGSAPKKKVSSFSDKQVLQSVKDLSQTATIIYNLAHERKLAVADDTAYDGRLVKLIDTFGPKEWLKQKIQEVKLSSIARDASLKPTLLTYVECSPLSSKPNSSATDLETETCKKLSGVSSDAKGSFIQALAPLSDLAKTALADLRRQRLAVKTPEPPEAKRKITGQTYYDDIDSMFDDARAKIQSNFDKFSETMQKGDLGQKLTKTSVNGQDLSGTMKQATSGQLLQEGSALGRAYKPALSELEGIKK